MKRPGKRTKSNPPPKRAAAKSKVKKAAKARASSKSRVSSKSRASSKPRTSPKSKARAFSGAGSKLARVATKAAAAAILAAGVAGIGTALGELKKEQTKIAPDESSRKDEGK